MSLLSLYVSVHTYMSLYVPIRPCMFLCVPICPYMFLCEHVCPCTQLRILSHVCAVTHFTALIRNHKCICFFIEEWIICCNISFYVLITIFIKRGIIWILLHSKLHFYKNFTSNAPYRTSLCLLSFLELYSDMTLNRAVFSYFY